MEPLIPIFEQKYIRMSIDREAGVLVTQWIGLLQLD